MIASGISIAVFGFLVEVLRKAENEVSSNNLSLMCTFGKWIASILATVSVVAFAFYLVDYMR